MAPKSSQQSTARKSAASARQSKKKTKSATSQSPEPIKKKRTHTIPPDRQQPKDSKTQASPPKNMPLANAHESAQRQEIAVVGIGSSAGGLEALEGFFRAVPAEGGLAFVVVTHQLPGRRSQLPDLLQKYTTMPVREAKDHMKLSPNTIFVSPPGHDLALMNQRFHVMKVDVTAKPRLPIDYFFRSLAHDQHEKAMGIVLSGTGSDGSLGLKVIKGEGGVTMVQDPATAKYRGMPHSAMATGLVDIILPVEELPGRVLNFVKRGFVNQQSSAPLLESPFMKTLILLREHTGWNFSGYKLNTIRRRVQRRMAMHHLEDPSHYNQLLRENPSELGLLAKELLIGVTTFFRDPDAWNILAERVLPDYLQQKQDHEPLRAWVAGCSSGEEAYSLAMVLEECLLRMKKSWDVKIFATDLDEQSIASARAGLYPEGIEADVTPDRLRQFFLKQDDHYQIRKDLRERVVFAPQNVLSDPPFGQLDILCCRNLLIYLESEPQQQLLRTFHYALKAQGILVLGPSETVGSVTNLFAPIDKKWRIFRRHDMPSTLSHVQQKQVAEKGETTDNPLEQPLNPPRETEISDMVHGVLAMHYAPPCAVVDGQGAIAFIHGRTGTVLEPSTGSGHLPQNVFRMARQGLQKALKSAVRQAETQDGPVIRQDVSVKTNGQRRAVDVAVRKLRNPTPLRGLFLITFGVHGMRQWKQPDQDGSHQKEKTATTNRKKQSKVEKDLEETQYELQAAIEALELANEELKSANEESQSVNEELQSTNEELETSKEEMQSLNEELQTVNLELQGKLDELSEANDDLQNIINSTEIATLFLDKQLCIKRFTPQITSIVPLLGTDVSRPINDLASTLRYNSIERDARKVLATLAPIECEMQVENSRWYVMRIHPYRTKEDIIAGVVLTFTDVTDLKREQEKTTIYRAMIESIDLALIGYAIDGTIVGWNHAAEKMYGFTKNEALGRPMSIIIPPEQEAELAHFHQRLQEGEHILPVMTVRKTKEGSRLAIQLSLSLMQDQDDNVIGFSTVHMQRDIESA